MTQYISLRQIADNISDNPLLQDIPFERIVNYAVTLMRIVGCPNIFIDKICTVEVDNYRAQLPCDFLSIIQIKGKNGLCYRYTTDSFHMELGNQNTNPIYGNDVDQLTYKLQGNYIYTSTKEDILTISYKAIPLDNEGFPLIPDNSSFTEALEYYIKMKCYSILFDQGKISPAVYQDAKQNYAWYVGQAQSSFIKPSLDQMENITAMMNRLVPNSNQHLEGFKSLGIRGELNTHKVWN